MDGIPLEDVDGKPLEERDSSPSDGDGGLHHAKRMKFKPSKWETVD